MAWNRLGAASAVMIAAATLHACGGHSPGSAGTPNGGADGGAPDSAGDAVASPWRSGSRLRARVRDGGDGARLFEGWWDRELSMPCEFRQASDHKIRCVPQLQLAPYYPADDCSTPTVVLGSAPEMSAGAYFSFTMLPAPPKDPPPGCTSPMCWTLPTGMSVGLMGDPVSISRVAFIVPGCSCSSFDVDPSSMSRSFSVVPPETFVAASDRFVGDPIAARVIEAEDGTVEVPLFVDATKKACQLASLELAGAPDVCMPYGLALQVEDIYAAPDCTEPVVPIFSCSAAPFAIVHPQLGVCPTAVPRLDILAAGAPRPGTAMSLSTFRKNADGTCSSGNMVEGPVIDRGAALDLTTLPALAIKELGSARLRARFGSTTGGIAAHNPVPNPAPAGLPNFVFYDTERGSNCTPQKLVDGTERCLPLDIVRANVVFFSDPSCTMPAALVTPNNGCAPPFPLIAVPAAPSAPDPTPPIEALYAQGDAADADIYSISGKGAGCVKEDSLRALGNLLAPLMSLDFASFAVVKTLTE